jgi:hypothetical protein
VIVSYSFCYTVIEKVKAKSNTYIVYHKIISKDNIFIELKLTKGSDRCSSLHGLLIRWDIGPKTVERSGNEYMNLRYIIHTYNVFTLLQLNKGSY